MRSNYVPLIVLCASLALILGGGCGPAAQTAGQDSLQVRLEQQLQSEFTRLGIDPAKVTAEAPSGPECAVFDLSVQVIDPDGEGGDPPTGVELNFSERAIGDYDQNGEVNTSDLTPLGANFGDAVLYDDPAGHAGFDSWPSGDPQDDGGAGAGNPPALGSGALNWRLSRIDGDLNGELNISDITPIANHWQERLDGYQIYRRGPGETSFTALPNLEDPLSGVSLDRPQPQAGHPVLLAYTDVPAEDGDYAYYIAAADLASSTESDPSTTVIITWDTGGAPPVNQPPVAALTADPDTGLAPLEVTLDGSGSTDIDGTITEYAWDFESDGTYDLTGLDAQPVHTFSASATVTLRVTDDDAATDTATALITITPPGEPSISGKVEQLTADWVDPFTPPAKMPLANVIIGVYEQDGTTLVAQSAPTGADGMYYIYSVPDNVDGYFVKPIPDNPALVFVLLPVTQYHYPFPFVAPVSGLNFLDTGGFHYPGEP